MLECDQHSDQMKKLVEKIVEGKHKKVEQALGRSLRNLFEQLAGVLRQLRCFPELIITHYPNLGAHNYGSGCIY